MTASRVLGLLERVERLTALSISQVHVSQVREMEQTAERQRNQEHARTLQQGEFAVQAPNVLNYMLQESQSMYIFHLRVRRTTKSGLKN